MQRLGLITAVAILALCGGGVLAGDVPLPIKKPKDRTGAVKTQPEQGLPLPSESPAAATTATGAASSALAKQAATERPKDATKARAVGAKADTSVPGAKPAGPQPRDGKTVPLTGRDAPATGKPEANGTATKPPAPPPAWTPEEIQEAKARCTAQLKLVDAVTMPEAPVREGNCGAPAPVRLLSIGKKPEVTFDPPALLTCDMVAMLALWMKNDVQPLARKHLGSEVIKIETMSDYSCRAAYGRKGNKLSEHAHANALDIRGFVTAKASQAMVLEGWGTPQREIAAAKALAEKEAAKADAIKAAAEKAAAERAADEGRKGPGPASASGAATASGDAPVPRRSIVEGLPRELMPRGIDDVTKGLGLAPSQLGGPKEKDKGSKGKNTSDTGKAASQAVDAKSEPAGKRPPVTIVPRSPVAEPPSNVSRFLHAAHAAACQRFGTTLGPEANAAHRNHFHVDMAPRQHTKICE